MLHLFGKFRELDACKKRDLESYLKASGLELDTYLKRQAGNGVEHVGRRAGNALETQLGHDPEHVDRKTEPVPETESTSLYYSEVLSRPAARRGRGIRVTLRQPAAPRVNMETHRKRKPGTVPETFRSRPEHMLGMYFISMKQLFVVFPRLPVH